MKRCLALFFSIFVIAAAACLAAETLTWSEISQDARDAKIQQIKAECFNNKTNKEDESLFTGKYGQYLKDNEARENFSLALEKDLIVKKDYRVIAHRQNYYAGDKIVSRRIINYSIIYNQVPNVAFHYHTGGSLLYMEIFSGSYPGYPYISTKYNSLGKVVRIFYASDKDTKFYFLPNGYFQGVLSNHLLYNDKGKRVTNSIAE